MFNWLKKKPAQPHAAINTLLDAAWNNATLTWQNLFGVLNHEKIYTDQSQTALKLTAVKCALEIYTGMVGSIPRRMYAIESGTQKKQRIVATTDHPASRLFSHYFNPELMADDALLTIIYDVLMDGNAYFIREYDIQGRTARLYYIHPSRITRGNIFRASGSETLSIGRKASQGELIYRIDTGLSTRDKDTQPLLVPRTDIVHFKGKVLDTEYHRGQGFVSNSTRSLDLYRASEEFGWRFYSRGIATQMFLTTENRLAPEVLKRIESNFTDDPNAPLEDIFRTRILEQGLKPVHMGIPFQHLQFIETRAFSVEDVARGLNVPPALLHSYMGTRAGDADLAQATSLFVQTGIGPFLSRLASQFRTELLPLPSQMLYCFEFELLYLYRNVIDKFSTSLRNLFEIGILDRIECRSLLGLHIDPADIAANPRYVPVNLMTVEHSLHLEEGAELANDLTEASIAAAVIANKGVAEVPEDGEEVETIKGLESIAVEAEAESAKIQAEAKPPSGGKMDKSPSGDNIDKRIRNTVKGAFMNVVNGLRQYETRVLDQKKQTRPDDYDAAVTEFYTAGSKFNNLLNEQLGPWRGLLENNTDPPNGTDPVDHLITNWLTSQKYPEGTEDEIARIKS